MNTKRKRYDVFISYRRKGGAERAELIKIFLQEKGFRPNRIFMDTYNEQPGDFRENLKKAIAESVNVIVIVHKGCFDEIRDEDYFVFELLEARKLKKNMVFCLFDITEIDAAKLPDELQFIQYEKHVPYDHDYANAFYKKVYSNLVKRMTLKTIVVTFLFCLIIVSAGVFMFHKRNPIFPTQKEKNCFDTSVVDLGLPSGTLWATCNLGTNNPSDFGSYYMWGSVDTVGRRHHKDIGYFISSLNIIGTSYDAASLSLGRHWRLPSEIQIVELIDNCKWLWTNIEGKNGYEITGPNGRTLFLPVAGCVLLEGYKNGNQFGYYWIGERHSTDSKCAKELVIGLNQVNVESGKQYVGRSIRPIYEK